MMIMVLLFFSDIKTVENELHSEMKAVFLNIGRILCCYNGIDQKTNRDLMNMEADRFLRENGFERDASRLEVGNIIPSPLAREIMGYEQMDYYIPIK